MKKDISSLRSTLEYLEAAGELVTTDVEVDPHLEVAAIQKRFDGGAALLFNKVKGYPNARICNNIFASAERIARLLDVDDPRKLKHKVVEALRAPLPPIEVKDGACQEVVVTKDIDVWDVVPMISHSDSDPGRTLGAGTTVVRGKHFWGGSHIGYNRMNFRGPDFSSFQISPGSHMDQVATHWYRKGPIPVTINIGIPPTCTMMAGSGFTYVILPRGCDELGVAGALQGYPVELVRARTQDAWSIANAEYVVEGYIDTTQKVWESPLAEKDDAQGVHPFHPEWSGYMGKSYRTYKFQATAITHRVNPKEDILTICEGGFGQTFQPAERSSAGDRQWTQSNIRFSGALGIDATRPFIYKDAFERARYNVEVVDLAKFYSPEQIEKAKAGQRDYAKFLAERGI